MNDQRQVELPMILIAKVTYNLAFYADTKRGERVPEFSIERDAKDRRVAKLDLIRRKDVFPVIFGHDTAENSDRIN